MILDKEILKSSLLLVKSENIRKAIGRIKKAIPTGSMDFEFRMSSAGSFWLASAIGDNKRFRADFTMTPSGPSTSVELTFRINGSLGKTLSKDFGSIADAESFIISKITNKFDVYKGRQ